MKWAIAIVVCSATLWFARPTDALARPRVVALEFSGPAARTLRLRAIRALRRVRWVPLARVKQTARQLDVSLDEREGRAAVARKLRVAAFISGGLRRVGRRWQAEIIVIRLDGAEPVRVTGTNRRASRAISAAHYRLRKQAIAALRDARPPAPSVVKAAPPVSKPRPAAAVSAIAPSTAMTVPHVHRTSPRRLQPDAATSRSHLLDAERGPARLELTTSGVALSRSLTYTDDIMDSLRTYKLPTGAAARLAAEWYLQRYIGLDARVQRSFGIEAAHADGTRFASTSLEYVLGTRLRLPSSRFELGLSAGYGAHSFTIEGNSAMSAGVPDTNYSFVRAGADVRVPLGAKLRVIAAAAYRHLLGTGELESADWFPRVSGAGVDGSVTLGYRLSAAVELALAASLRRYFFAMNPEPGDPNIAGGAVDQLISVSFGLIWRLEDVR